MDARKRRTDLHQIHTGDVFGLRSDDFECQGQKSKVKVTRDKKNTPAVWTEWNPLVADNVVQAADATIRSLQRDVFAGMRALGLSEWRATAGLCHAFIVGLGADHGNN